jgi:tRNA pseudouridine13 synthase
VNLPLATAELPGCGGRIKVEPEDFEVEELPAYPPSGEGEHLFVWLEKRGRDTQDVAAELARGLGLPEREVSYAGMKDRHAVTRQFLCVPAAAEARLAQQTLEGVRLLWWRRHTNRLRTGHLHGNRFRIRIREVKDGQAARAVIERLQQTGLPNYFGSQRFGQDDQNAGLGKRLLLGQRLPRAPTRFLRKLFLSSYQAALFNRLLAARLLAGQLGTALAGDVLRKADTGGLFVCEDPAADQPRVDRFEVSAAGPMFGPKMVAAAGEVGRAEGALLTEEGLTLDDFRRGRGETEGTRRAYRIRFAPEEVALDPNGLLLAFELPKGCYATVLLREVMKDEADPGP